MRCFDTSGSNDILYEPGHVWGERHFLGLTHRHEQTIIADMYSEVASLRLTAIPAHSSARARIAEYTSIYKAMEEELGGAERLVDTSVVGKRYKEYRSGRAAGEEEGPGRDLRLTGSSSAVIASGDAEQQYQQLLGLVSATRYDVFCMHYIPLLDGTG
eukprot:COSAG05_NODE_1343_length_5135_cov_4.082208_1_plen_158_part_00